MIIEWLEKGPLDLEYKQYKLLAYLKQVDNDWNDYILYPHLSDIVEYNSILTAIRKNKNKLETKKRRTRRVSSAATTPSMSPRPTK